MKSHLFLAFGDEQNHSSPLVTNITNYLQHLGTCRSLESPVEPGNLRSFALKSAQQGDYRQAIALLNELILRHPENAVDYNNRGLIYFQKGEIQKALADYNTALRLNPNLASAYNNRANYYAAIGELEAALADYDEAIDLNPRHVRARINRGITLRDLGRYEEAIEEFEDALLFRQLEANILAERGRTNHLWGEWNCAVADYNRALAKISELGNKYDDSACRLRLQVENWLGELLSPASGLDFGF